ncbi:MAG: hypothetical protein V7L01_19665 [Nostoc sp.]|uniref:hypothetical protein n=1 Tax=Nostoc sp. TaxID=1180 RepID=UPI002FF7DBBD
MLSTKENLKQIEMDTIQQEPLLTELTPEAAATVEGGLLYRVVLKDPNSSLNVRSLPNITKSSKIIDSFKNGAIINASVGTTGGFRKLIGRAGWVAQRFTQRVLNTSAGFIKLT